MTKKQLIACSFVGTLAGLIAGWLVLLVAGDYILQQRMKARAQEMRQNMAEAFKFPGEKQ